MSLSRLGMDWEIGGMDFNVVGLSVADLHLLPYSTGFTLATPTVGLVLLSVCWKVVGHLESNM